MVTWIHYFRIFHGVPFPYTNRSSDVNSNCRPRWESNHLTVDHASCWQLVFDCCGSTKLVQSHIYQKNYPCAGCIDPDDIGVDTDIWVSATRANILGYVKTDDRWIDPRIHRHPVRINAGTIFREEQPSTTKLHSTIEIGPPSKQELIATRLAGVDVSVWANVRY